jgi:hypothetical protein
MSEIGSTEASDGSGSESEPEREYEVGYRYATADDIRWFYGVPIQQTIRAYVWTLDGEVEGVVGMARGKDFYLFFSDVSDEMLPLLKTFTARRPVIKVVRWIRDSIIPVYAEAQSGDGYKGRELLSNLGFVPHDKDVFVWPSTQRG